MEKLPNEILTMIFSYLRAKDLVEAQKVSSVWYEACQSSYIWRQLSYNPVCTVTYTQIEGILRRAPRLQSFLPELGVGTKLLQTVMKSCPHIRKLCLNIGDLHLKDIVEMSVRYPFIEDLKLRSSHFVQNEYDWKNADLFGMLDSSCRYLKRLDLHDIKYMCAPQLSQLRNTVQLIDLIVQVSILNDTWIYSVIALCTNLESLTLRFVLCLGNFDYKFIGSLSKLKHLKLMVNSRLNTVDLAKMFSELSSNLQYLEILNCDLDSDTLIEIFSKCSSLKSLHLFQCDDITGESFLYISNLQQLQTLRIVECEEVSRKAVQNICELPNLRALYFLRCPLLDNYVPEPVRERLSCFEFEYPEDNSVFDEPGFIVQLSDSEEAISD